MRRTAAAATLFDDRSQSQFEDRLRCFAREVAKRHRGHSANPGALVLALRGYHRVCSLFERVPALDERTIALAVAEYGARSGRRHAAA